MRVKVGREGEWGKRRVTERERRGGGVTDGQKENEKRKKRTWLLLQRRLEVTTSKKILLRLQVSRSASIQSLHVRWIDVEGFAADLDYF